MDKIKIGIIGTGYIGGVHAQIFASDERCEVAALYDIEGEKAGKISKVIGGEVCHSAEEVIEKSDAVLISTPNTQHTELAIASVEAGRHVFCEKPFSTSLEKAKILLETAQNSQKIFQVGHNRRFAPVYVKLKELIAEDEPHSAHVKMNRGELLNPEWTGDPQITGGFLYETTIHLFDMMRFQFGELAELVAFGSTHDYPEVDDFSILMKFHSGFHATFASASDASWIFPFERMEVFCHHRTILTREMEGLVDSKGTDANYQTFAWHQLAKEERWGYVQEDRAFIDAIINNSEPPVTALDGYKSVELVESVYQAVKTGERIKFD